MVGGSKRVRRITHVITGLSQGGAEHALYRLLAAQPCPSQHSVVSLTDEGVFGDRLRGLNVNLRCLNLRRGVIPSPVSIWRLRRVLRELQPQVVQTWMYHADLLGGVAARLAGVPVCWGLHHSILSPDQNRRLTLQVASINARLSEWVPSRIVSCSRRAVETHRSLNYANKFVVIPNGLDLVRYAPKSEAHRCTVRRRLGLPDGCAVIGHIGRADRQKDHPTLLRVFGQAAAQCGKVRLLLAGVGFEGGSPYLERLIREAGVEKYRDRIIALGRRDDVPELMAAMDIFLLSSVSEALPTVVIEAMACGTPCVVTDVGDSAAIVGGTGWVAPAGRVDALTNLVMRALNEPEAQQAARRRAVRQRAEGEYGIERMVAAYWEVWESVATTTREPAHN